MGQREPSGKARILKALEENPQGVTRVDFLAPNVIDGYRPYICVPQRIEDLRKEGYEIETLGESLENGGTIARWKLVKAPVAEAAGIPHTPHMAAQPPQDGSRDGKETEDTEVVDPDDPWSPTDPSGGQLLMFPEPPPKPVMGPYEVAA